MQDMNIEKTLETDSSSYEATLELGSFVGSHLRGREIFELVGDLGAGKTAFTRGLVSGVGSKDEVTSPSFTISNIYQADKLQLNHFDFYRLSEAGIMSDELSEALSEAGSVSVIEWSDVVHDILPANRVQVKIEYTGEKSRHIIFTYPEQLEYLFEGLTRS